MIFQIVLLLFLIYALTHWRIIKYWFVLPSGPFPLPIVGNLLQLDPARPQITLKKWKKKYGPVFTIWFTNRPTVVVTDYEIAKDAFTKHGNQLSNRADSITFTIFGETGYDGVSKYRFLGGETRCTVQDEQ